MSRRRRARGRNACSGLARLGAISSVFTGTLLTTSAMTSLLYWNVTMFARISLPAHDEFVAGAIEIF